MVIALSLDAREGDAIIEGKDIYAPRSELVKRAGKEIPKSKE